MKTSIKTMKLHILLASAMMLAAMHTTQAEVLTASDGEVGAKFGNSVSLSGTLGLVGAYKTTVTGTENQGAAYVYRNLDTATGTVTEAAKLIASDGAAEANFGSSASLSGTLGLVGAFKANVGGNTWQGATYVYRNLDTATGTVTEAAKLIASDGAAQTYFGGSTSLSGTLGLVGATATNVGGIVTGASYVYRNLDTATGTVTEAAKLIASNGGPNDSFGESVSLSGAMGLVGATGGLTIGGNANGTVYVYRNLDTVTGTVTEAAKLIASDGGSGEKFGSAVSLSGALGLVGANSATVGSNTYQGAAYVYRNLDTATGTVTQNVKLTASDGAAYDLFGASASLSGTLGIVGAYSATVGANTYQGAAYVYRNLDTANGTVTQNVKLTASDGAAADIFGVSASLYGDEFIVGAMGVNTDRGKAYAGSISSLTTLDTGSTSKTIGGISFVSQDNWIIGQTTGSNQVTLSAGDTANVTATTKAVYIGQNATANNNKLVISGNLTANTVLIGSIDGNTGNTLQLDSSAAFSTLTLQLTPGNQLDIQGDYSNITNLFTYLGSSSLQTWNGGVWNTVSAGNYSSLISNTYSIGSGYTSIGVIPEPSTYMLLVLGSTFTLGVRIMRQRRSR